MPASDMAERSLRIWWRSACLRICAGWSLALPPISIGRGPLTIRLGDDRLYRWEFERADEQIALDVPGAVTIDNTQFGLSLALAGGGLAYLPQPCVEPSVARGELRVVLADWGPIGPGFHIYYPGRRQLPTGLRLLTDLIREVKPLGL